MFQLYYLLTEGLWLARMPQLQPRIGRNGRANLGDSAVSNQRGSARRH